MATNRRQFLKKILYGAGGVTAAGVIYSQAKIEKPQIIVDGEELKEQNHEDTDQDLNIPTQYHPAWDLLPANSKAALLKQNFVDPLQLNYTGGPGRHINSKRNVVVGDYEVTSPDLFVDDLKKENRMNNRVSKGRITSKRHKRLWDAEVRRQNYEYYEEMYNWCIKNDMPSLAQWYKLCMEDISK